MDYNSLVSTVAARLNMAETNAAISGLVPDFIARAEDEIFAGLAKSPVRPMQTVTPQTVYTDSFAVPTNFIDMIDLLASDGTDTWQLARLGLADSADYYATRALPYRAEYDSTKIRHYWIAGSSIYLPSAPDPSLDLTMRYFVKPIRLDSGNLTNWVIASHGDVYEFGTLMHAARHLRDDDLEDRMADRFATAMGLMLDAYPERQNPTELSATDLPLNIVGRGWNIMNG